MTLDVNRYRALMLDGTFVLLEKDCECVGLHDGPHWLHMDEFDKATNRKMGEDAIATKNVALWRRHCLAEMQRLDEKLANLKKYGIAEVFPPGKPWPVVGSVQTVTS
mgnify:FL=1